MKFYIYCFLLQASLLFILSWPLVSSQNESTLKRLFVIYRHGDRAPISLYHSDPNPESNWPDGLGELTIIGKKEQYALGEFIRQRYSGFITDDIQEVSIRSSDENRCLDSAQCNSAGLYPPTGRLVWKQDLNWQPLPIHTTPKTEDMLLTTEPVCPEYDKELERIKQTPAVQDYLKKQKSLFDFLSNHSGQTTDDWVKTNYLYDTLFIEKLYNLSIPDWANEVWGQMKEVSDYSFTISFSTQITKRLRGGSLLGDIIAKMENTTPTSSSKQKVFVYSTHDTMVAALLSTIGVYNAMAPPYCSTVLVELHENGKHGHVVRLFYRNTTDPASQDQPFPLVVPGCETDCPLGHFVRLMEDNIPIDWKEECGIQKPSTTFSTTVYIIIGTMGLVVLLLLFSTSAMLCLKCQKEKSGVRYQRVPGDLNS